MTFQVIPPTCLHNLKSGISHRHVYAAEGDFRVVLEAGPRCVYDATRAAPVPGSFGLRAADVVVLEVRNVSDLLCFYGVLSFYPSRQGKARQLFVFLYLPWKGRSGDQAFRAWHDYEHTLRRSSVGHHGHHSLHCCLAAQSRSS